MRRSEYAINSMVTSDHTEEQSVGFLAAVPHPVTVTDYANVFTISQLSDKFLYKLTQLDQTSLIVTSYGTRNQTKSPEQMQGLGSLNGHISYDENCLELFGQVPEWQWSS